MEQHRNARAGETGDPRESPPTRGIVRRDYHLRKSWSGPAWVLRADEIEARQSRNARAGKRRDAEKSRRPVASSSTIPTCEDPGVTRPGIEPGSLWSDEALDVRVSVARIAPSLLDLGHGVPTVSIPLLSSADADNRTARISRNALDAYALRRNILHPDRLPPSERNALL
ncbi:hypothetical protein PR048_009268 [Dryococelus australis]|uniref:Uncharacterized protein n=1 Tax=Dryococelus australis TaxID=614101 RepID=A0ABQ9I0H7_9NEOP|nr:hypothetical protein PR048_009268 [Dryococelus australis]